MISVIIPVSNCEDNLHVCINSLLKQTYSDFELICIENAYSETLEYFSLKDNRVKIIKNETQDFEKLGLKASNGEYVLFLSCNEWLRSNTLEVLFNKANNNNLEITLFRNDDEKMSLLNEEFMNKLESKTVSAKDLDMATIDILNRYWNKFYLKSFLDKNSINDIFPAEKISSINLHSNNTLDFKKDMESLENKINRINFEKIKTQLNDLSENIEKEYDNSKEIKEFIKSQKEINNKLMQTIDLFTTNYNELKTYFYNDCEDELKKYLNTDELFRLGYFNNFKFLSYSPVENRLLIKTEDDIILGTNNRFYTIKEVIGFNGYSIPQLYEFDEFTVFDIGMNRAYASLWFTKFNNCKEVHGFEIDPETYQKALNNISLNPKLSKKIKTYNFGLSDEDGEVDLLYADGCDGVNTMFSEVAELQGELKNKVKTKKVEVKKATPTLSKIIDDNNIDSPIVLKIDTEGAEYAIISDLIESKFILKFDVILGEGHVFKREHFCDKLEELGFRRIKLDINQVTYNFAFVKEKYFDVWPLKE